MNQIMYTILYIYYTNRKHVSINRTYIHLKLKIKLKYHYVKRFIIIYEIKKQQVIFNQYIGLYIHII